MITLKYLPFINKDSLVIRGKDVNENTCVIQIVHRSSCTAFSVEVFHLSPQFATIHPPHGSVHICSMSQ